VKAAVAPPCWSVEGVGAAIASGDIGKTQIVGELHREPVLVFVPAASKLPLKSHSSGCCSWAAGRGWPER